MNLIIEAGGTKSNLAFVENGEIIQLFTEPGIQLSQENAESFEKRVIRWSEFHLGPLQSVYLFAAGKIDPIKEKTLTGIIKTKMNVTEAFLYSDLLAACYATAGNHAGIVGILGTGSNTCYYNGKQIEKNISPGGFILGDEGGGAYMGKQLLIDYLRNQIPANLKKEVEQQYQLTNEFIIQQIYGGSVKSAANFCSSLAPFVVSNLNTAYCMDLCTASVQKYLLIIEKNYLAYSNQLYMVGSIAFHLQHILKTEAAQKNIEIIKLIQHPIKDLSLFLSSKQAP